MVRAQPSAVFSPAHHELIDLLAESVLDRQTAAVIVCIHTTKSGFSAQIQQTTGLAQTDVSKATSRLVKHGLIHHERVAGAGRGRPRKRYLPSTGFRHAVNSLIAQEQSLVEACEQNIISIESMAEEAATRTQIREG